MANFEIEVKAWVRDKTTLRSRLVELGAKLLRSYTKSDRYYRFSPTKDGDYFDLRLRNDGDESYVTFKKKNLIGDAIEQNEEYESAIGKPEVLERIFLMFGAQPLIEKTKVGEAWELDGATLEVSDVAGLGTFIEVEILLEMDRGSESDLAATRHEVLEILHKLNIDEAQIEPRTYTSMLREAREKSSGSV